MIRGGYSQLNIVNCSALTMVSKPWTRPNSSVERFPWNAVESDFRLQCDEGLRLTESAATMLYITRVSIIDY